LRQLAFDAVPKVFGFDYQTVEASMTEAEGLLTPAYRTEFAERAKTDIIPAARERRLVTQVTVTGAGVLDAHRDTGSVLVFMNRTVTDKSKKSQYDGSRLRVDFTRVDGHWLINYIVPV
jgi:Mce-associated membrane protein